MIGRNKILILGFIFLISLGFPTSALKVSNFNITPESVWLNDGNAINISFSCSENANVSANIIGSNYNVSIHNFIQKGQTYSITYHLTGIKESADKYTVTVFCENSSSIENKSKDFYVNKFSASITDVVIPPTNPKSTTIYLLDPMTVKVKLDLIENGITTVSPSGVKFNITIDNKELNLIKTFSPENAISPWKLKVKVPENFKSVNNKNLVVNAVYKNHSFSATSDKNLNVKPLLDVNILEPSILNPYKLIDTADINLSVKVDYKSKPVDSSKFLKFKAKLNNEEVTIRKINYKEGGVWRLYTNIPKQIPRKEPYNLDIFVTYENTTKKSSLPLPIQFVIPFKGTIVDADNSPVYAEIKLRGEDIEEKLETDNSGKYSIAIVPGIYDVELTFDDVSAKFYDAILNYSEDIYLYNPIKYDFFEGTEIDAVKVIALEFASQFQKAHIIIPYVDSEVDEDKIIVYQCRNWNFGKRYCNGDWKRIINYEVDKNKNLISFDVSSLSTFAVSEEKSLQLEINLDKESYFMGESATLHGRVFDNKNNSVGDSKISYSISDSNISGSTTTNNNGEFTISFNSPEQKGISDIVTEAGKMYASAKKIISFNVYKKKELKISVPNYVDSELCNSSTIKIIVENTGQVSLSDIDIKIENIPFSWYTLNPSSIDKLGVGEQREIEVNISVSKEQCVDCKNQYSVGIKVDGEANATKNFIINIKGLEPDIKESEGEVETNNTINIGAGITGFVTATSSLITQNIIVILFLIILVILYKIIIRKREGHLDKHKVSSVNIIKEIKDEILKEHSPLEERKYSFQKSNKKRRNKN